MGEVYQLDNAINHGVAEGYESVDTPSGQPSEKKLKEIFHVKLPRLLEIILARIFHELPSRDHKDGRATWQLQGVDSEAYLNGTSQGPTPEEARKDGQIRGRSK
jgi:hypothetical protein